MAKNVLNFFNFEKNVHNNLNFQIHSEKACVLQENNDEKSQL